FVYDYPKAFISHGVNFVEDVREFLDRRDDNTSSRFQCGSQIAGGMGVGDDVFYFGKAPDVLFQLPVEDATVGDDNDGVEHGPVSVFNFNQLEGCPGNGVRFTGTGRMLNKVRVSHAVLPHIRHQFPNHIELVVTREYVKALGKRVFFIPAQKHVVLDDLREYFFIKYFLPKIGRTVSSGVYRIALSKVIPFVEGEKYGVFSLQFGGHIDLIGIHREMHKAAAKREQGLRGIARVLVLAYALYGCRLSRPCVFQFDGTEGNAVYEEHHVNFFQRVRL